MIAMLAKFTTKYFSFYSASLMELVNGHGTLDLTHYDTETLSVIIPLVRNQSSASIMEASPSGEFVVLAPPNYGVMVVVQSLRLRVRFAQNSLACRDYLKVFVFLFTQF